MAVTSRQQPFRSGVQVVLVDATVRNGHAPVSNLTVKDFVVADNGIPQSIDMVSGATIPLDVTLVVNTSQVDLYYGIGGNAPGTSAEVQHDVRAIAATLRADDRLAVTVFASDVIELRPLRPIGLNPGQLPLANPLTNSLNNRYRITEALVAALTRPVPSDRRHIVVVFALGTGTPPVSPSEHLVAVAERADARLYAVLSGTHVESHSNRPFAFYPSEDVIRKAVAETVEATGGKIYFTSNIVSAFGGLLKDFRSSYLLRYALHGVPSAGWHDIVVTVPNCHGCVVHARRGYVGQ